MWHVGVGVEELADAVPAVSLDYRAALRGGHLGKEGRERMATEEDESRLRAGGREEGRKGEREGVSEGGQYLGDDLANVSVHGLVGF